MQRYECEGKQTKDPWKLFLWHNNLQVAVKLPSHHTGPGWQEKYLARSDQIQCPPMYNTTSYTKSVSTIPRGRRVRKDLARISFGETEISHLEEEKEEGLEVLIEMYISYTHILSKKGENKSWGFFDCMKNREWSISFRDTFWNRQITIYLEIFIWPRKVSFLFCSTMREKSHPNRHVAKRSLMN